jgi:hypothetical protein
MKRGRKPVIAGLVLELIHMKGGQITGDYRAISQELNQLEISVRNAVRRLLQDKRLVLRGDKLCLPTVIQRVPEDAGLAEQLIAALQRNKEFSELVILQENKIQELEEKLVEAVAIAKQEDEHRRQSLEVIRKLQDEINGNTSKVTVAVRRFTD